MVGKMLPVTLVIESCREDILISPLLLCEGNFAYIDGITHYSALLHFCTSLHLAVITQQTVYHTAALPQAFHMLCHRQYSSLPGGRYRQIKDELTSKLYENCTNLLFVVLSSNNLGRAHGPIALSLTPASYWNLYPSITAGVAPLSTHMAHENHHN